MEDAATVGGYSPHRVRVCVVVYEFPMPSETFVVTHVEGLLSRGHDVVVIPVVPRKGRGSFSDRVESVVARSAPSPKAYPVGSARLAAVAVMLGAAVVRGRWRVLRFAFTRDAVNPRGFTWRLLFATRFASIGEVDVVHAHFESAALASDEMGRRGFFTAPLVASFHGHDVLVRGRNNPAMYAPLHSGAARVTVTTKFMRRMVEGLGFPSERIRLWPQGVDVDAFTASDHPPVPDAFNVVSVARLVPFKGHDVALRVIAAARPKIPGVRFTIVGEGELRPQLEALAAELGIDDITTFEGAQQHERVVELFRGADAFLHMGTVAADGSVEAQGVSPAEASASGLPIVATFVGGLPEVVLDGETGLLVADGDVAGGAAALVRLQNDPALRARLGAAGRAFVERHYARDATIGLIEDIYREVCA